MSIFAVMIPCCHVVKKIKVFLNYCNMITDILVKKYLAVSECRLVYES